MNNEKRSYKDLDEVAKSMGLKGKGGQYETPLGLVIDASACEPNRLAIAYVIAKTLGHINKW